MRWAFFYVRGEVESCYETVSHGGRHSSRQCANIISFDKVSNFIPAYRSGSEGSEMLGD